MIAVALVGGFIPPVLAAESGDIDVHMVTHSYAGRGRGLPRAVGGLDAAWVTDDVPAILGRPARSFEQFAADHAAAFS